MVVRYSAAVLAVLLVLLLGVRPLVKAVRGDKPKGKKGKKGEASEGEEAFEEDGEAPAASRRPSLSSPNGVEVEISRAELLTRQVGLAQQLVSERPDSALQALRQMLNQPEPEAEPNAEKAA